MIIKLQVSIIRLVIYIKGIVDTRTIGTTIRIRYRGNDTGRINSVNIISIANGIET